MNIPRNEVKINNHLFLLIFSLRINALASMPKGIASWDPRIMGEIIEEWYKDKFINTYTSTPIESEKIKRGLKNFLFGIRNLQNGIKIIKTNNILNEINRIDGIMGDVVRPVRDDYLHKLQRRKADLESEFRKGNLPPPPRM